MEKSRLLENVKYLDHVFCNKNENGSVPNPVTLTQIHSFKVIDSFPLVGETKADALVTDRAGISLTMKTADCAPVLLADTEVPVIGAAHAGWKGALTGVIEQTILAMVKKGARIDRIVAAVGPCIHVMSYPVGEDMRRLVAEDMLPFFENINGKDHFNLPAYVQKRLQMAGIEKIDISPTDTFVDQELNSYRRDPANPGRQYSAVWIKS